MAFDASIGCFLDADDSTFAEALLGEIDEMLRHDGLPEHREPRSWDEVFARHPMKRRRRRTLGARLGFYGAEKYHRLEALAVHLAVIGMLPDALPVDPGCYRQYESIPDRDRCFDHMLSMLKMSTALVPCEIPGVLERPYAQGRQVLRVASAPRLLDECARLAYCVGGIGVRPVRAQAAPEGGDPWDEELDLCLRLSRVAKAVLWSGAFAFTS